MAIINGVEKQFSEKRITSDFQNALHTAYKKRKLQVDHDHVVSQTISQQNSSQIQRRKGKSHVMPNTYATVVTANLNQQSGDLNLTSLKKQTNQSLPQMIMSPKSMHASSIARHRMVKPSNKDLQVDSSGSASAMMPQSTVQSGSKILRRRPQTTKRDYGAGMTGLSGITSSALTSDNVDVNYNEAALLRT